MKNNSEVCTNWIKCEYCKKYEECFAEELQNERKEKLTLKNKEEKVHSLKKAFWEKEGGASEVL